MTTTSAKPTPSRSSEALAARTTVHLIMQGKGGVGKSLIAAMVAQYLADAGRAPRCYDTDPVNATLAGYEALKVTRLELMAHGGLDVRKFDLLMEDILTRDGATFVVDSGASSFLHLAAYMAENDVHELLAARGVDVVTHCVITGGQAMRDTVVGLDALARIARERSVVVWVNEYFGRPEHEGKGFQEMPVYAKHAGKFRGVAFLQQRNPDTFGRDVGDMVRLHRTFDEALAAPDVAIMVKSRLKQVRDDVFGQLRAIGLR